MKLFTRMAFTGLLAAGAAVGVAAPAFAIDPTSSPLDGAKAAVTKRIDGRIDALHKMQQVVANAPKLTMDAR